MQSLSSASIDRFHTQSELWLTPFIHPVQVMAHGETSIEALNTSSKDEIKVEENTSPSETQQAALKPQDGSKDERNEETVEQNNFPQTTQGLEVTPSQEASKTKSASDELKNYSSFTAWEKRFIVFTATIAALFSPFTAQIYFPALNTIAKDLNVTNSKVNLTVTTYMVCVISKSR